MRPRTSSLAVLILGCLLTGGLAHLVASLDVASSFAIAAAPTANDVLKSSADAITKAKALSYRARAFSEGTLAAGTPIHDALVTAVRADAGGWKLAVSGTAATTAKDVTESSKLELAYDGASAWALKEKEKIAFTESIRKDADVETFFKRNSAGPAVAWELFVAKPMSMGGSATLDGEGQAAGEDCVIVKITGGKGDADNWDASLVSRIFISKKDNLPRRFERVREIKDTNGTTKGVTRVLELSSVKTDKDVVAVPFTLSAPDGYTIRTTPGSRGDNRKDDGGGTNPLKGPGITDSKKPGGAGGSGMMDNSKRAAFPDFKLKDPAGKEYTLDSYKGEIVVIDFWATWCGWCIKGMPDLQKIHDKYKDKKVKVVGINLFEEKPEDAVKFKKDKKYTYGLLLRGDDLGQKLKITGIPVIIVLDGNGKVIERIGGYDAKLQDRLSKLIDKELEATAKK